MTLFKRVRFCLLLCLFGLTVWAQSVAANVIEMVEFRGLSRVSVDSVKAVVVSKAGDVYDEEAVRRDFNALWDTGRFSEIQVKKETGKRGGVVLRFVVTERA